MRSRLYEIDRLKKQQARSQSRLSQIGTGDRSEKIRTYNFKENRVSDHRIGLTIHQLDTFMEGYIDEVVDALISYYQAEKLKEETARQVGA